MPERQFVSLKIYNTLGELIAEPVNEIKEAVSYSVMFDASSTKGGLPSGVYIYRLQATELAVIRKMTLLKQSNAEIILNNNFVYRGY